MVAGRWSLQRTHSNIVEMARTYSSDVGDGAVDATDNCDAEPEPAASAADGPSHAATDDNDPAAAAAAAAQQRQIYRRLWPRRTTCVQQ